MGSRKRDLVPVNGVALEVIGRRQLFAAAGGGEGGEGKWAKSMVKILLNSLFRH